MSKTPEQISNLCVENDKLRELWRIRDAIVDAALKWDLPTLKALCDKHRSAMVPAFIIPPLSAASEHFKK